MCDGCWAAREPGRRPVRLRDVTDPCCWCGKPNDGIYVRADPAAVPCHGKHPADSQL